MDQQVSMELLSPALNPSSEMDTQDQPEGRSFTWWKILLKIFCVVGSFIAVTWLLEHVAEERVDRISEKVMELIGLPGLFIMVFLADGMPQPFTYVPLIFMAVKGGTKQHVVFIICSVASYSAALFGYFVGYRIRNLHWGNWLFTRWNEENPMVAEIMQRRGAVGVAIAALLPIPLAIATWTAGSFRINFPMFLLAGGCRMPKIAVFILLSAPPRGD